MVNHAPTIQLAVIFATVEAEVQHVTVAINKVTLPENVPSPIHAVDKEIIRRINRAERKKKTMLKNERRLEWSLSKLIN